MVAYQAMGKVQSEEGTERIGQLSHALIEKVVNTFKTHRSALDHDIGFVTNMHDDEQEQVENEFVREVLAKMKCTSV